ncbi:DVU_1555 family C-GCAxxG-C-C protein [uncultured Cohaesibacter sp.]|uniref:DVU_1555 family C-GCAxxG-C-C protein n=1 Tax=uncultured Cohaesibacter sp. TaxID=1002546 RepID=UPI0029C844F3|nr:DV_1555 family C-GCAxxG-C-C protein [uncultured Cohaesibacter sp.]
MTEDSFRVAELLLADLKCSHIMMILALEAAGRQDPNLVRAMSGLAVGMGQGMTCGILSAGCCVVGMLAGKASEEESEDSRFVDILEEFGGWFKHRCSEEYGGCSCSDIMQFDLNLRAQRCPALISESWQKLNEILERYDLDITHPPRGGEVGEEADTLGFLS